jgi:putative hydrolase of the HAD superfamily
MIPYRDIDTIFLDVGNTLISIDFAWVCRELAVHGLECTAQALARAEAAGRPIISAQLLGRSTETRHTFELYLRTILDRVAPPRMPRQRHEELIEQLMPLLYRPGESLKLWSVLLPGVPEALTQLHEAGYQLAVVSNSDGTVETGLAQKGLRKFMSVVVDSHVVGFEKPDPRIFHHALDQLGADPSRTLHVGDMYAADVVGARAAGIHPVLLDPFDDWGDVDCERVRDVRQLAERLLTDD